MILKIKLIMHGEIMAVCFAVRVVYVRALLCG